MANNDYTVPIYYQDPAGLSPNEIQQAFQALQGVYGPITLSAQPWPTDGRTLIKPYFSVIFANHGARGSEGDMGGETITNARRAYIYPNQLDSYGSQEQRALEYVIGHELGHLLGLQHAVSGLMSPHFTSNTLQEPLSPLYKQQLKQAEKTLRLMRARQ